MSESATAWGRAKAPERPRVESKGVVKVGPQARRRETLTRPGLVLSEMLDEEARRASLVASSRWTRWSASSKSFSWQGHAGLGCRWSWSGLTDSSREAGATLPP